MPRDDRRRERVEPRRGSRRPAVSTSWDPLATWYNGWVGEHGSEYHREVAIPALLRILAPQPGEHVLDIGAGQGVLAPYVTRAGAVYTGVDASPRLITMARQHHRGQGRFLVGDARRLQTIEELERGSFDAACFLLSLQDMDPLHAALAGAAWALRDGGRLVLLLTHPAFRIPRQSGWGWDEGRKLVFRRIDRYLTPLPVPLNVLQGRNTKSTTRSFHRPLQAYINGMAEQGLLVDHADEIPAQRLKGGEAVTKPEAAARDEIPLFLGLRALKLRL